MYYQIRILKGRNTAVQKKIETVFGKKMNPETHLVFRKSNCEITVKNYSLKTGTLEFEVSDPLQAEVIAASLSRNLKGISVLLTQVRAVKWYAEMHIIEYRDGKIRNRMNGRGTRNSTVYEAVGAYLLHRQLSE